MDERAVSVTVSTVITLAITTILVSGLVVAASDTLSAQQDRSTRNELQAVGQRVSTELVRADSLAYQGSDANVTLRVDHVATVGGSTYTVGFEPCAVADACLSVAAPSRRISVTIPISLHAATVPVRSTVSGGHLRIVAKPNGGGGVTLTLEAER